MEFSQIGVFATLGPISLSQDLDENWPWPAFEIHLNKISESENPNPFGQPFYLVLSFISLANFRLFRWPDFAKFSIGGPDLGRKSAFLVFWDFDLGWGLFVAAGWPGCYHFDRMKFFGFLYFDWFCGFVVFLIWFWDSAGHIRSMQERWPMRTIDSSRAASRVPASALLRLSCSSWHFYASAFHLAVFRNWRPSTAAQFPRSPSSQDWRNCNSINFRFDYRFWEKLG